MTKIYELRLDVADGYISLNYYATERLAQAFIESVRKHDTSFLASTAVDDIDYSDKVDSYEASHPLKWWLSEIEDATGYIDCFSADLDDMSGQTWATMIFIIEHELIGGDNDK